MGDEAIEGSKMGSKLIMFGAIVALAIVAFLAGKNLMGTGIKNMEDTVAAINDSRFSDYNGKIVRGRQVKYALDTFANENVAIFIHTLAMGNGTGVTLNSNFVDATSEANPDKKHVIWKMSVAEGGIAGDGGSLTVDSTSGTISDAIFVNYGSILAGTGTGAGKFKFKEGTKFTGDFATSSSGTVSYNGDTQDITKQGNAMYVADSANYNAALIKNESNEIIGILFYQMKTN